VPYTLEEQELLACIADQVTSVLLNLRLTDEVAQARELEAFRTMSAFFVHDLKNTASSLKLMLQNLPVHFDDPEFRQDALRSMGNTAWRIDEMIQRLSALRRRPEPRRERSDLNQLIADALAQMPEAPGVELVRDLQPLPPVLVDPEQLRSVVTNLVANAREAVAARGRVEVRTAASGGDGPGRAGRVVLSVADNGCGMTPAFVRDSLFRPFQSTKSKGLGIGMFQARMIVEAHGGAIQVESDVGAGTTFRVSLPAGDER
jgi:putative PEP-CTERM system histidine kinase